MPQAEYFRTGHETPQKNPNPSGAYEGERRMQHRLKIGIIGFGSISQRVVASLGKGELPGVELTAILVRDRQKYEPLEHLLPSDVLLTADAEAFFARSFELVIEVASQDALRQYSDRILSAGRDLMAASIGAFTDKAYFDAQQALAEKHHARLLLISGALPAVDWMRAVAMGGTERVAITQRKPAGSWCGTPAEEMIDLSGLTEPTTFFEGSAREAASTFQKSSNIAAMLALCTAGMDNTRVHLVADPHATSMHMGVVFKGPLGKLSMEWESEPTVLNPSTSVDVPMTVIKALQDLTDTVVYGV
jgi:aspartate dehydrogenase